MRSDNLDDEVDTFLATAVSHGLLRENHVEKILIYSRDNHTRSSDAALTLSMLQQHEVEAIKLLCNPRGLAPGYELTGLIGCGAGGLVFRARQIALDRDVAIKTINPQSKSASATGESRIKREAHAIAKLQHPGIVAAFDSGFFQGRFCIAMELVEGESLAEFIHRQSPIAERVAWEVVRQVACALSHACDAGIIHRDIKPANLLLSTPPTGTSLPDGVPYVKVADFGLASLEDEPAQITVTGATLGTPSYVAPEQLLDPNVDARADIYALGATVFHMLCGHPPCSDQSAMKTILQKSIGDDHWRDEIDPVVSAETLKLFREMTETNPDHRVPDYDTLIKRIDLLLQKPTGNSFDPVVESSVDATMEREGRPGKSPDQASGTTKRFRRQKIGISVAFLVFLAAFGYGVIRHFRYAGTASQTADSSVQWLPDGSPERLFNGTSVPLFRQSNIWTPTSIEDGSRVLAGKSGTSMTIPLTLSDRSDQHLRFRIGINLDAQSVAEIGLLFSRPNASSPAEIAVVRFANGKAQLVVAGEDASATAAASIPLNRSAENPSIFQSFVLMRHPAAIQLFVNNEPLGILACDPSSAASVVLRCDQGVVNFADIDLVALKPSKRVSFFFENPDTISVQRQKWDRLAGQSIDH